MYSSIPILTPWGAGFKDSAFLGRQKPPQDNILYKLLPVQEDAVTVPKALSFLFIFVSSIVDGLIRNFTCNNCVIQKLMS
jgi:hypothetical protein